MYDTPEDIQQKQREIFLAKSEAERFMIGLEFVDFGWQVMVDSIKHANPGISHADLIGAILKRCYGSDFTDQQIADIVKDVKSKH